VSASAGLGEALRRLAEARDDETAWRTLYAQLWPYVVAIAFREARGRAEVAEDAAQETFLRLVRYATFRELQDAASLRAYAATVVRRVTGELLAHESRRGESSLDATDEGTARPPAVAPLGALPAEEALERLRPVLNEPEMALLRLLLSGNDVAAVAAALGIRYGTAAVRIHRLRAKIKKHL